MVLLRILSKSEKIVEEIAKLLLSDHLAIDINVKRNIERAEMHNGQMSFVKKCLLTAKTKGLLFPQIDQIIRKRYKKNLPEIYSIPIVHMDWEQAELLTKEVQQV